MINQKNYLEMITNNKTNLYKKDLYNVKVTSLAEYMQVDEGLLTRVINGAQEPEEELRLLLLSTIAGIKRERDILDAEEA